MTSFSPLPSSDGVKHKFMKDGDAEVAAASPLCYLAARRHCNSSLPSQQHGLHTSSRLHHNMTDFNKQS